MECYFGGPVLLNLILRLILDKSNQEKEKNMLSTIALGTYKAQTDQLKLLNEILWRNSISLTSEHSDMTNSDLKTLKFYLQLYLSAIDKMHAEHDIRNLIAISIEKQNKNDKLDIEHKLQIDYFQPVEELRKVYCNIEIIEKNDADQLENMLERGKAWMLLGYVQLLLFGSLDLIDPVHKIDLKLNYLEEDITDCRNTVYVTMLQDRILGISVENQYDPPRLAAIKNCEKSLLEARNKLSCLKAFRPSSVNFILLSKCCADFRNTVGSYELVEKHINNLLMIATKINDNHERTYLKSAKNSLKESEIWSLSIQRFSEQIETKYLSAYPDVILPLLAALAQLRHGVCILINETRRLISLSKNGTTKFESLIYNLIRFPTIGVQQENLLDLSALCVSRNTRNLINENSCSTDENSCSTDAFVQMREQFQIFKSGLHELHNYIILNRGLTKSLLRDVNELLQQIVMVWKQQQQEEEKQAIEKESIYKNKIQNHGNTLTEEEELTLEVRKLFPTHRDTDFHDIEDISDPSLDRKNVLPESNESISGLITKNDIMEIQQIHSNIVTCFTASKWIYNSHALTTLTNYVRPLLQRYNTIHGILDNILPCLSGRLSTKLYKSLNLLVALSLHVNQEENAQQYESTGKKTKVYDFYRDCNIEETKRCLPLCDSILNHVNQLLEKWPDHPTLKSIQCIIERIYTFSITSAVYRFLTGLELLLEKMQQWEENAHSGVTMSSHIAALTQQIISWRKLELSCWQDCLDAAFENLKSDTSKWWFFLYTLIESYITESMRNDINETKDDTITKQKLIESLERFMNESSLVEFESRLNLLLTFHCHVYYLDDSERRNELSAILWNIYNYYKQFMVDVNARIEALKAPIEKKLKDFVKIARWNDITYWSVKKTVEKTHRTLHKFIKEYQNAVKQNVSSCLTIKSKSYNTEISKNIYDDQEHRKYLINPTDYTIPESLRSVKIKVLFTDGLLTKTEKLLRKTKQLCKELVLNSSYPCIRIEIENFVEDFMEQSARLRDMEIDRSLPKKKQKSQAKSILQQKKMTLANYFKTLTRLGVSYRMGTLTLKNNIDKIIDYTVSPLDLSIIDRYFKLKNIDQHTLMQWQGCEKYYYKSLIGINALTAMLSTNQTDLGLQNIERCRGYSAHMMLMAHRQKTTIVRSFDCFTALRMEISNLSEMYGQEYYNMPRQCDIRDCAESLKTLLIILETGFEQLVLSLLCCPIESSSMETSKAVLTLDANTLPITATYQNSEVWRNANDLLNDSLKSLKITATRFHSLFMPLEVLSTDDSTQSLHNFTLTSKHFEFLKQSCAMIEDLRVLIKELKQLFACSDIVHPIYEDIMFLDMKMKCFIHDFEELRKSTDNENPEELKENNSTLKEYELTMEQLLNVILLAIQKKYKDHVNSNNDADITNENLDEKNENNDDLQENFEENRLNEKLIESLENDIDEMKLSKVSLLLASLLQFIQKYDLQSANYCIR